MEIDREHFLAEVEARLRRLFSSSKSGYRASAMDRHRLEGFMQAGVFMGLCNNQELSTLMEELHLVIFGKSISERQQESPLDWRYERIDYSPFDEPAFTRNATSRR